VNSSATPAGEDVTSQGHPPPAPIHGTLNLPTKGYLDDHWGVVTAHWVKYDNLAQSFEDRMLTLRRLAPQYPHYVAALAALPAFD
jgi:hypothetical protein